MMCDKSAFRDPSIEPKTTEELLELAQKKKRKEGRYASLQEDYFR